MSEDIQPELSVIIPCFNVEKWVEQCVSSVLSQTLKNIEIICINDGSTDATGKILDILATLDQRVTVIHKNNSGYGATVNQGIQISRGKYIGIIESDDFIEPNMFELLFCKASQYKLDISRCCYFKLYDSSDIPDNCPKIPKNIVFSSKELPETLRHPPSIWAAIYRRKFLIKNKIKFLETSGASYQDISFAFKTAILANKIYCIEDHLLHYRIHSYNSVKSKSNVESVFYECDEIINFCKRNKLYDDFKDFILHVEYATFKWNYLRLPNEQAKKFLYLWSKRWKKNAFSYLSIKHLKLTFYVQLIVKFPYLFNFYLSGKHK